MTRRARFNRRMFRERDDREANLVPARAVLHRTIVRERGLVTESFRDWLEHVARREPLFEYAMYLIRGESDPRIERQLRSMSPSDMDRLSKVTRELKQSFWNAEEEREYFQPGRTSAPRLTGRRERRR